MTTDSTTTTKPPGLIARLLGSERPSPAEELRQALAEVGSRRKMIDQRLAEIQQGSAINGGPGPERRRVLETGTADAIVALDHEVETLLAERDQQLPAQEAALRKRLEQAEADEARQRLPGRVKSIPAILAKHQKAAQALQAARDELDAAVSDVIVARRLAGDDAPGLDDDTIGQIADMRGLRESEDPSRFSIYRANLFRDLGGSLPEKADPDFTRTRKEVEHASEEFHQESSDGGPTRRKTGYLDKGGALRQD